MNTLDNRHYNVTLSSHH